MINNFTFYNPTKIFFGKDCLQNLIFTIKYKTKILLIYEGSITKKIGVFQKVMNELKKTNIEILELDGVTPNPENDFCKKGAKIANENKVDLILAVGGGSVIDAAKVISILTNNVEDDIFDYIDNVSKPKNNPLDLYVVLTSAATSSENSPAAVISDSSKKRKSTYFAETAFPKIAFCDPTFTFTLPKFQTASGAFDIYSHVIEQFMSIENFDASELPHLNIIKSLIKWVPIALKNPQHLEARANIMWCSTLALNGHGYIGKNLGWYAHRLSYPITTHFKINHGASLAITMPYLIEYILQNGNNKDIFRDKISKISKITFGHKNIINFIYDLKKMILNWGLDYKISKYESFKINEKILQKISEEAFLNHSNPSFLNANKIVAREIYERIFSNK